MHRPPSSVMGISFRLAAIVALAAGGCSGSKLGAEVSGNVTLDGKAVGPGVIVFAQDGAASNPSEGTIQPNGSYFLKTSNAIGLTPGKYRAAVTVFEPSTAQAGERSYADPVYLTPEKYARQETSGLEFDVKPGRQTIDVELSSK